MGHTGVITHLQTIDPNFQRDIRVFLIHFFHLNQTSDLRTGDHRYVPWVFTGRPGGWVYGIRKPASIVTFVYHTVGFV